MSDITNALLNPVRMRIVQELASRESITATELCERMPDVPRTTMYRHVKVLLDSEVLRVVSERQVRGSTERSLALDIPRLRRDNSLANAEGNAFAFLMNRYAAFQRYFSSGRADPGRDRIFMNDTILMLDDEEFDGFLGELRALLIKYGREASAGRKARDIAVISSPVGEE